LVAIEECRRDFATWHQDVLTIIDAVDTPYKWALLGRQPLQRWSVGRVSLLGDACHPMVPSLGQGANMAIEDGMVLARCLEASADVATALHRYEVARLDRTSRIGIRSLELISLLCNNPQLADPDRARVVMERESTQRARYDWLYDYNAMTAPI
jgi:salicylate hydroxylase